MEPVDLRTPRTVLSAPTTADADAIYAACQDADIQRYTTVPSPYLREHADGFIPHARRGWEEGTEATWAIRDGAVLAGMIGLHRLAGSYPELGYWMTRTSRGRGLLTEAAGAVLDWAFASDGVDAPRVEWRAVVGNRSSARVARAVGFRFEGTLRSALPTPLGRQDAWIAGILPTDPRTPQPWPVLGD